MSDTNAITRDGDDVDGWTSWRRGAPEGDARPRLRLLYHGDLDRLGWLSIADAVPAAGRRLTVGRHAPLFAGAAGTTPALPIGDPAVSREQLHLRWLPDLGRFEVEPIASARRPVALVDLTGDAPVRPLTAPALLEPGACVAIGDRVLLGLELGPARPPDADRLGLVGESEALWALRDEVRRAAPFARPSLILGPTGAGKELVARALHALRPPSTGRRGAFVPVNCAALPEQLVESVLFGHRRGAFTGADADQQGLFRAAEGGTLFLDEVGELPAAVQPKLLRVLQESVVTPVGAHEGRRVDVRVVAATHRDPEAQVRAGSLREDLYHRLAAHVLRVPPLAARRFDVPELFAHLLARLRDEHGALGWLWESGRGWQPAVPIGFVVALLRHDFRGNVRELQNLVEQTARLNHRPGAFHAPDAVADLALPAVARPPPPGDDAAPEAPDVVPRAACEALGLAQRTALKLLPPAELAAFDAGAEGAEGRLRARAGDALFERLAAQDFNQTEVAADLGVSRTTLIKLMDDLGLPRATNLTAEEIEGARVKAGGDLDAAARLLRVSPTGLKKRLTLLNLKSRA